MESRAHGVLGGKIGRIKKLEREPRLASGTAAGGGYYVEEAKDKSVPKPDRIRDLVKTVMGMAARGSSRNLSIFSSISLT